MEKKEKKVLPYNLDAEQSVLACVLLEGDEIAADILPEIDESHFYLERNKTIVKAMKELYKVKTPIDMVTLTEKLEKMEVDAIAVADLLEVIPSAANYKTYLEILKRDKTRRDLIRASRKIIEQCQEAEDRENAIASAQKLIFDVGAEAEIGQLSSLSGSVDDAIAKLEDIAKGKIKRGVTTGYKALDNILNGLNPSDLILLAARPGEGKTSLAMNIVENAALLGGATCAVFSLEMPRIQIAQRMLCGNARVSMSVANKGGLERAHFVRLAKAQKRLEEAKIFIDDTARVTPIDILNKCRRLKAKHGLDLVMIDYLQLMTMDGKRSDNRVQEIADITRNLKIMARDLNVPVVLLSQLSRAVENREPPIPMLADLRDSGAIEQDADIIIFIHNPSRDSVSVKKSANNADATAGADLSGESKNGIRQIMIAKHRNGETGTVEMKWSGELTRFSDMNEVEKTQNNQPMISNEIIESEAIIESEVPALTDEDAPF